MSATVFYFNSKTMLEQKSLKLMGKAGAKADFRYSNSLFSSTISYANGL